jgi:hypothetical protein
VAFGLGLVAQQERPGVGLPGETVEAFGEKEVSILRADHFDVAIAHKILAHENVGMAVAIDGLIEAGGEETGFEAGGAEQGLLREGDAFDGEKLLGIDGAVGGDEVLFEAGDLVEFFQAHDGEGGSLEPVLAGILGGAGLALGGARSGGACGVGAVGGELRLGERAGLAWHVILSLEQ